MTLDAKNVRVARTGAVYVAPLGTTLPTGISGGLDAAFVNCGYVSEDGVTFTPSETVNAVRAWQNNARVNTTRTETEYTFQFVLIEDKGTVVELFHRGLITPVGSGEWLMVPDTTIPDVRSFVVDVVDGTKVKRHVVAQGEITERGEIVYSGSEAIGYNVTVTCYYDEQLGAPYVTYTNDPNWGYS